MQMDVKINLTPLIEILNQKAKKMIKDFDKIKHHGLPNSSGIYWIKKTIRSRVKISLVAIVIRGIKLKYMEVGRLNEDGMFTQGYPAMKNVEDLDPDNYQHSPELKPIETELQFWKQKWEEDDSTED